MLDESLFTYTFICIYIICGRHRTIKCSSNQNVRSKHYYRLSYLPVKYVFAYLVCSHMIHHQHIPARMKDAIIVIWQCWIKSSTNASLIVSLVSWSAWVCLCVFGEAWLCRVNSLNSFISSLHYTIYILHCLFVCLSHWFALSAMCPMPLYPFFFILLFLFSLFNVLFFSYMSLFVYL